MDFEKLINQFHLFQNALMLVKFIQNLQELNFKKIEKKDGG